MLFKIVRYLQRFYNLTRISQNSVPSRVIPESFPFKALPGSAWVKITSSAVEVDCRFDLDIAEAAGHAPDILNLEGVTHRIGHQMLVVSQEVVDVSTDQL